MSSNTIGRTIAALETAIGLTSGDLVFIRHGNHWLQCTQHGERQRWTQTLAYATLVTRAVARDLVEDAELRRKHYDVQKPLEAWASCQGSADAELTGNWTTTFEDMVRKTWPKAKHNREGILVNAHMHLRMGRKLEDAVRQYGIDFKLPKPSKILGGK